MKPWEQFNGQEQDTEVVENTTEGPKPWEKYGNVKKKGNTLNALVSQKPLSEPGSEESGAASEPPTKPSGKAIVSPDISAIYDLFSSAGKTAFSTLKQTLPQAIDYLNKSENFNPPQTYEEKISDEYADEAYKNGISKADQDALKEFSLNKRKQLVGEAGINAERLLHDREIKEKKIEAKKIFEQHNIDRSKELEGVPQTYQDVKDVPTGIKYTGGLVGQALASFPLILTGGASEGADAYYEGVDEKAKKLSETIGKKITPEEVIKLGLDKDAQNHALGVQFINGALDVIGFETILGSGLKKQIVKEAGKELAKKGVVNNLKNLSKPALGEALTETAQELDTFVQSRLAAGRSKEEIGQELKKEYPRLIDSALGGFVGGGVLGGGLQKATPHQVISNAKDQITSTGDIKSIEDHAAKIIESVKQAPEEGVTNAIQEQSPSSILQHTQEGTGETGSGRGRMEPSIEGKEIAGTFEQNENITPSQKTQENLTQQQNENDTGVRGPIRQGRSANTEEGRTEQEISSENNGSRRTEEIRSRENGGVRGEGQEKTQQVKPGDKIFVYGTLKEGNVQKEAFGEEVPTKPAEAKGNVTEGEGFKDFHSEGKNIVKGEVLTVTPEQLKQATNWEQDYNRKKITLANGEQAWVFEEKPKEEQKHETEQVSPRSEQERSGIEQKDAENITRQVQESIPKTEGAQTSTREIKKEQDKALESYAKSNGSYIEDVKKTLGEKLAGGIEQDVYLNKEGDKVIKINGLSNHSSWGEFWDRLNLQNTLFPNTGYELKGFTKVGGRLSAVLEQPYIEGSPVPRQELIEDLAKRGFYQIHPEGSPGENQFYNPDLGVRLSDVHGENVIKDQDGNIRYIDPMLDRENPFVDEESQKYFNEQKKNYSEEPPVQTPSNQITEEQQPQGKQFALAKRIEASDVQEPVKAGVRAKSTYTPKGLNITEAEAQKVIDENGLDATEAMVKDSSNSLTSDQRVVISGKLYENYTANGQNVKAVDIAIWAENFLLAFDG